MKRTEEKYDKDTFLPGELVENDHGHRGTETTVGIKCAECGKPISSSANVELVKDKKLSWSKTLVRNPWTGKHELRWDAHHNIHPVYYCTGCKANIRPLVLVKMKSGDLKDPNTARLDLALALRGLKDEIGSTMTVLIPKDLHREVDEWAIEFCNKIGVSVMESPIDALVKLNNAHEVWLS